MESFLKLIFNLTTYPINKSGKVVERTFLSFEECVFLVNIIRIFNLSDIELSAMCLWQKGKHNKKFFFRAKFNCNSFISSKYTQAVNAW